LVFCALQLLPDQRSNKFLLTILAAAFIVLLNFIFIYSLSGEPFHLLNVITSSDQRAGEVAGLRTEVSYYFKYLFVDIRHTWLLAYIALFGAIGVYKDVDTTNQPLATSDRYFVILWLLGLISLLTFFIMPNGNLIYKQTNYLLTFMLPLAMLAGFGVSQLKKPTAFALLLLFSGGGLLLAALEQQAIRVTTANSHGAMALSQSLNHPMYTSPRNNQISLTNNILEKNHNQSDFLPISELSNTRIRDKGPLIYAIIDLETASETSMRPFDLARLPRCWEQAGLITPAGYGIGHWVLTHLRAMSEQLLPSSISRLIISKSQYIYQPQPAYLIKITQDCETGADS